MAGLAAMREECMKVGAHHTTMGGSQRSGWRMCTRLEAADEGAKRAEQLLLCDCVNTEL